jgi:DNA (cytosine-5)-methyltransferase 1
VESLDYTLIRYNGAMRILDLYCGAGGAAKGYSLAGFEVVGVDHLPQPNYPFRLIQSDALETLQSLLKIGVDYYDAIHASPPCQAFSAYRRARPGDYESLIEPTRELLKETGLPYVIENVPGAPLIEPIQLCGTSFPHLEIRRHRLFECSFPIEGLACNHGRLTERKYPGSSNRPNGRTVCNIGEWRVPLDQQKVATDIDWMTREELAQSIPPAYTEYIGTRLKDWILAQ